MLGDGTGSRQALRLQVRLRWSGPGDAAASTDGRPDGGVQIPRSRFGTVPARLPPRRTPPLSGRDRQPLQSDEHEDASTSPDDCVVDDRVAADVAVLRAVAVRGRRGRRDRLLDVARTGQPPTATQLTNPTPSPTAALPRTPSGRHVAPRDAPVNVHTLLLNASRPVHQLPHDFIRWLTLTSSLTL